MAPPVAINAQPGDNEHSNPRDDNQPLIQELKL